MTTLMTKFICMQKTKDLNKSKYQFLIKKGEDAGKKHLNDPKIFIEYTNITDDVYNNINYYIPKRKRKLLVVFDDMIVAIMANKNFPAIIRELYITAWKKEFSSFWKGQKRSFFLLVFVRSFFHCIMFISYFLNFPSIKNVRTQYLSANAYSCVNMKFSYLIDGHNN